MPRPPCQASAGSHDLRTRTRSLLPHLQLNPDPHPSLPTRSFQLPPFSCRNHSNTAIYLQRKFPALFCSVRGVTRHDAASQSTNHDPILLNSASSALLVSRPPAKQGDGHAQLSQATCRTSVQAAPILICTSRGPTIRSSACPRCSDQQNTRKFYTSFPNHPPPQKQISRRFLDSHV